MSANVTTVLARISCPTCSAPVDVSRHGIFCHACGTRCSPKGIAKRVRHWEAVADEMVNGERFRPLEELWAAAKELMIAGIAIRNPELAERQKPARAKRKPAAIKPRLADTPAA